MKKFENKMHIEQVTDGSWRTVLVAKDSNKVVKVYHTDLPNEAVAQAIANHYNTEIYQG